MDSQRTDIGTVKESITQLAMFINTGRIFIK